MAYAISFHSKLQQPILQEVWNILCICDNDFIPPLSSRESSSQNYDLDGDVSTTHKPYLYFEELKGQSFLIVKNQYHKIVGFLSFKHHYKNDYFQSYNPSNYATTTCILPEHRNNGIGKLLYDYLENDLPTVYQLPYITRRTWSSNYNQIHIYEKMSYQLVHILENHRGKGVHSLYYAKKI